MYSLFFPRNRHVFNRNLFAGWLYPVLEIPVPRMDTIDTIEVKQLPPVDAATAQPLTDLPTAGSLETVAELR
ncbi:MAG: hypothetical protein ACO37W_09505 [Prochlorotrichaceae cyanobacterium]|jgi:hypothetical protein